MLTHDVVSSLHLFQLLVCGLANKVDNHFAEALGVSDIKHVNFFVKVLEDELQENNTCGPYIDLCIIESISH